MNNRVIVHLSSNWGTSNFGDVLFAEMIVDHLSEQGYEVALFDASPYVKKYLYEVRKLPKYEFGIAKADVCVYFAGGYFGEKKDTKLALHLLHFYRFMLFGLYAKVLRKRICVIGIGAGDYLWGINRIAVKDICRRAEIVTTRDIESTMFLKKLAPKSNIVTCSDIAQTVNIRKYQNMEDHNLDPLTKLIYLHVNDDQEVNKLFVDSVAKFILDHPEYKVIIGNDILQSSNSNYQYAIEKLGRDRIVDYEYTWPDDLCRVLHTCRIVLTYKLHIGIVGSAMGCSVLSFSKHTKIPRYYTQIGCPERCIAFIDANEDKVVEQLNKYADLPVEVPEKIMQLANDNWRYLDSFLAKC